MALTILTGSSQAAAFNYSYTTSGSADWASVPTASYFYDIMDKTIRFKDTTSTFSNIATASFALTASNVSGTVTSASYAATSSYAMNGGVTQLLAGPNVILSPTNGLGQVTVSATLSGSTSFNTATGSYGSFYSTQTQTNVAGTARSMSLNTTDITNGVSISGSTNPFNTYIKTQNAGIYNIQFSAQVDKTDSGTDEIWIWIRKNGTNLTDTATSVLLQGNGAHYVAAWNFFVNAAADDYFQLMWYSPDANVRLHAEPAFGVVPGIPSLIVTANRVDQFLSNTGSFSGSFTGGFTGSLQGTATTASFITASNVVGTITSASYAQTAGTAQDITGISSAITNNGDNYLLTATGTGTINGEDLLTFDGNTLTAMGTFIQGEGGSAEGKDSHVEGSKHNSARGDYSHSEGEDTIASGSYSHAEGSSTQSTGYASHAEGQSTQAQGDYSHAEGSSTQAIGQASHAEGENTQAIGDSSHVAGLDSQAIGNYSYAEGFDTRATGIASHAEGTSTQSQGNYSHAEGTSTQAIGESSHAEGGGTQAIGNYSHAEGNSTQAIGDYSHTEGQGTIASGSYQHVSGQFNTHGDTTSLFIVGNGVDDNTRKDAFKVTPSGSIVLPNTSSGTPGWTGTNGEMVFGDNGAGSYRIFVWLGGAWRSGSLS